MSSDILTFIGTTIAALFALFAAVFTSQQSRKAQETTAQAASDAVDREAQRKTQIEMLNLLRSEVESLNKRVVELRERLINAEDSTDRERKLRRDVESRVEELQETLNRMLRIIATAIPDARSAYPDLFTPPPTV